VRLFPEVQAATVDPISIHNSDIYNIIKTSTISIAGSDTICGNHICFISVSSDDKSSSNRFLVGIDDIGNVIVRSIHSSGDVRKHYDTAARIIFDEETEAPSVIMSKGVYTIIGTTHGALYVVTRNGLQASVERLQPNCDVFFGILRSGAKLLGLTPGNKASRSTSSRVLKVLPIGVSANNERAGECLVVFTLSSLSLWSNWVQSGQEKLVWECDVSCILEEDARVF
jgi:hypothetical protein